MGYSRIVEGSAKEIAEQITRIAGDRRVSVLLIEESPTTPVPLSNAEIDQALADLDELAVRVGHADDSREAIYTRYEDE